MARLLVEGWSEGSNKGSFHDANDPQVVLEGSADPEVAYRIAGGTKPSFIHDATAAMCFNGDPVTVHAFKMFLRGTDIPGGEMEITALYTLLSSNSLAALASEYWPSFMPLLAGQSLEVEMLVATVTTDPTFEASYRDVVLSQNDIKVSGERVTQQCVVIENGTPYVIAGPAVGGADDFTLRQLRWTYGNSQNCLLLFNPSGNTADITVTLHTADGEDTILFANPAVVAGQAVLLPAIMNLREGDYVTIATGDEDLFLVGSYTDYV